LGFFDKVDVKHRYNGKFAAEANSLVRAINYIIDRRPISDGNLKLNPV
jgi:hypothetical protein